MATMEQVLGSTYVINTKSCCIPCYFLNPNTVVLLDSGIAGSNGRELMELLDEQKLTVRAILTSHAHFDHNGNHRPLREKYGAVTYASVFNAAVMQNPVAMKSYLIDDTWHELLTKGGSVFCPIDEVIDTDQTEVVVDGARFEVLPLPGHSPEHIGFVTPDGVAYLADVLVSTPQLKEIRLPYIICAEPHLEALQRLRKQKYNAYILAHRGWYKDVSSFIDQNVARWENNLQMTWAMLSSPMTQEECAAALMKHLNVNCRTTFQWMSCNQTVRAMMQYLVDQGKLVKMIRDNKIFYSWA